MVFIFDVEDYDRRFKLEVFLCNAFILSPITRACGTGMATLTIYMLNLFRGNNNIYLHFMSFLHIDMTQIVEILPQVRPWYTYHT